MHCIAVKPCCFTYFCNCFFDLGIFCAKRTNELITLQISMTFFIIVIDKSKDIRKRIGLPVLDQMTLALQSVRD